MFDWLRSQLGDNQFLQGGLVLGGVGGLILPLRQLVNHLGAWLYRRYSVTLHIEQQTETLLFEAVSVWLRDAVIRQRRHCHSVQPLWHYSKSPHLQDVASYSFRVANGTYWFWRNLRLHRAVLRDKSETSGSRAFDAGKVLRITVYGSRCVAVSDDIISTALQMFRGRARRSTEIVGKNRVLDVWNNDRPWDTLYLPGDVKLRLESHLDRFVTDQPRYAALGIPYQTGIILEGPPGSGKSSLAAAIAYRWRRDLRVIEFDREMDDSDLRALVLSGYPGNVLLLEDVDALFASDSPTARRQMSTESKLTFSGLLNALDGVGSGGGRIVVMTTNHIERLDPALIRPGRIDLRLRLGNPTLDQVQRMGCKFYSDLTPADFDGLDLQIVGESASMAWWQGQFLACETSDGVRRWLQSLCTV